MSTVDISKRIRQARKETHLSQQALAQAIGVSDKSISAYEKGRAVPSIDKLKKIATSTNQSLNFFTEEKIEKNMVNSKLNKIEQELKEIRKLLKKSS